MYEGGMMEVRGGMDRRGRWCILSSSGCEMHVMGV